MSRAKALKRKKNKEDYQTLLDAIVADPLQTKTILTAFAHTVSSKGPVPGVVIPVTDVLTLSPSGGDAIAVNTEVVYHVIYFPHHSKLETYVSLVIGYDDVIVFQPKGPVDPAYLSYIDLNFYYRGDASGNIIKPLYNGSITQSVSSYEYDITLPPIVLGASQAALGRTLSQLVCKPGVGPPIVRTLPIDWIGGNHLTTFLYRTQSGNLVKAANAAQPNRNFVNVNQFFDVTYYPAAKCGTGPYYSLTHPAAQSYFTTPYRIDYPVNVTARAEHLAAVEGFGRSPLHLPREVGPFFFFSNPEGQPVDCAYACVKYQVDNGFDNRSATYFTSALFPMRTLDQLTILQYNQALEPSRCQYSTITIYTGSGVTSLVPKLAVTTIPQGRVPIGTTLVVHFTNQSPSPVLVAVAERIYQYPPPAYNNTVPMSVFYQPYLRPI